MTDSENAPVLNRRQVMVGAGTIAVAACSAVHASIMGPPVNAASTEMSPTFAIPPGATDCHVHVFSPVRFPYADARSYTPGEANLEELEALRARLRTSRLVLVQPSVYGTDNRCLIDALTRLGSRAARAIAVIDAVNVSDSELNELQRIGVAGVRVNLNAGAGPDVDVTAVSQTLARVTAVGLSVQMYIKLSMIDVLAEAISKASVPVVLDHFAGAQANLGLDQPGFTTLRRLLSSGKVWVKLSAPYRASQQGPDFPDIAPIARALIQTNADHLLWGSDWPHTGGNAHRSDMKISEIEPFQKVDDSHILGLLSSWAGDKSVHRKILVDNPERLYGSVAR
jgi:predicted TIM-barrel fold metal-dependent hydrolase